MGSDLRSQAAAGDLLVGYSPAKVVLHRHFAPNKIEAPVLRLQHPISLKGGVGDFNTDSFSGIDRVQLVGKQWKALCGRKVRLIGRLDEPDSGNGRDSPADALRSMIRDTVDAPRLCQPCARACQSTPVVMAGQRQCHAAPNPT